MDGNYYHYFFIKDGSDLKISLVIYVKLLTTDAPYRPQHTPCTRTTIHALECPSVHAAVYGLCGGEDKRCLEY